MATGGLAGGVGPLVSEPDGDAVGATGGVGLIDGVEPGPIVLSGFAIAKTLDPLAVSPRTTSGASPDPNTVSGLARGPRLTTSLGLVVAHVPASGGQTSEIRVVLSWY